MDSIKTTRFVLGRPISLSSSEGDSYLRSLMEVPGLPERDIVNLICAVCAPDSHMLDVGANIGYISAIMSLIAPRGKIHAFEPAPKIFRSLKANIKANGLKNVTAHELGLSDDNYETTISYPSDFPAGAFVSQSLRMERIKNEGSGHMWGDVVNEAIRLEALDDVYKKLGVTKCDLLKVDIEGHEASFLAGAKGFIAKFKPVTIMEVNHWCLNVFSRTSLPDFIESVYEYFPCVFAFGDGRYLDLSDPEARYLFYYENAVNNKLQNLLCGFDGNGLLRSLNLAFDPRLEELQTKNTELSELNARLDERNAGLSEHLRSLESARSHRMAMKANRVLRRGKHARDSNR